MALYDEEMFDELDYDEAEGAADAFDEAFDEFEDEFDEFEDEFDEFEFDEYDEYDEFDDDFEDEFDDFEDERRRAAVAGRRVGLGIVNYVEGTGIGPYEGARVTVEPGGTVSVVTGVGTQGQGHFTAFAQVVGERLQLAQKVHRLAVGDRHDQLGAGAQMLGDEPGQRGGRLEVDAVGHGVDLRDSAVVVGGDCVAPPRAAGVSPLR